MKEKTNIKVIFTIPNILCYFRILLIPIFCYLYLNAKTNLDYFVSTLVVLISSLTDLFDGMIARKFNQVTELGKVLDPVADKITHLALAICISIKYPLMWLLLILMVIKEGFMAISGTYFLKKNKMMNGAMWYGKICTASLFIGLLVLFTFPNLALVAVNTIIIILMIIMLFTFIMYIIFYLKMYQEIKEK